MSGRTNNPPNLGGAVFAERGDVLRRTRNDQSVMAFIKPIYLLMDPFTSCA